MSKIIILTILIMYIGTSFIVWEFPIDFDKWHALPRAAYLYSHTIIFGLVWLVLSLKGQSDESN